MKTRLIFIKSNQSNTVKSHEWIAVINPTRLNRTHRFSMYHPIKPYKTLQNHKFAVPISSRHLSRSFTSLIRCRALAMTSRPRRPLPLPTALWPSRLSLALPVRRSLVSSLQNGAVQRNMHLKHAPRNGKKWKEGTIWSLILCYIHVFGFIWIYYDLFGFIWPNGFHWWMDAANLKRW